MFYLFIIFVKLVLCIFNDSLQIIFSHKLVFNFRISILQMLKEIIIDCSHSINYKICEFKKNSNKSEKKYKKIIIYLIYFYFSAYNFSNFSFNLLQSSIYLFTAN